MDLTLKPECRSCPEPGHSGCFEDGYRAGRDDAVRRIEARVAELERYGPSLLLTAYRLAADLAQGDQPGQRAISLGRPKPQRGQVTDG